MANAFFVSVRRPVSGELKNIIDTKHIALNPNQKRVVA
jgi:hypothetical protein